MKSFQLKESRMAVKLTLSILWKTHTAIPSYLNNYVRHIEFYDFTVAFVTKLKLIGKAIVS